jgi:hypothetical protein
MLSRSYIIHAFNFSQTKSVSAFLDLPNSSNNRAGKLLIGDEIERIDESLYWKIQ